MITMAEVQNAKVRAKLVVLSCCHSASDVTTEDIINAEKIAFIKFLMTSLSGLRRFNLFPGSSLFFLEVERRPWERGCVISRNTRRAKIHPHKQESHKTLVQRNLFKTGVKR